MIDEADQSKWDVTGLCETYTNWEGVSEIKRYVMYEIGKTEDDPDANG